MFAGNYKAKLFMNYHREDTAPYAGRLYDLLTAHFGKGRVLSISTKSSRAKTS
jgi:hypothetical protein